MHEPRLPESTAVSVVSSSIPPAPSPESSPRWWLLLAWIVVAAIPVVYIVLLAVTHSRNIVFWDEFDTALALLLRIHDGAGAQELWERFFAINNEHRTLTSRLMFAVSYWLTGTVNFHVIGAIGNLFHVATCAILILAVKGWERRTWMGVVLAFLMFQLEHFESFLWSGASIDHFQVVTLVVGAIAVLAIEEHRKSAVQGGAGSPSRLGIEPTNPRSRSGSESQPQLFRRPFRTSGPQVAFAALLGFLATFTLAQGTLAWPIGAGRLWYQRRWRHLIAWCISGAAVMAIFLHGFEFNPGHHISDVAQRTVSDIALYWLALLGAPLTLGDAEFAPWPGALLLIGLGVVGFRGGMRREPVAWFSAVFAIAALGMVAVGRSGIASGEINSRYMVLGALGWAMLIYLLLVLSAKPGKPYRQLRWLLPALAAFNVSANLKFRPLVDSFIEVRDRAATTFMQYGQDGRGITRLHPIDGHADIILKMTAERGIYHLPRVSHEKQFPDPELNPQIITHIDELVVNDRAVTIGGWAMIPGRESKRGEIHVVLRSEESNLVFSTVTLQRPDVARAYREPRWRLSGFRAVIERPRLPAEDFVVGVIIAGPGRAQLSMTQNQIQLAPGKPAAAKPMQ